MGTPLKVVPLVEPYLPSFARGAFTFAKAHGAAPERVSLIAAICLRESWAGTAPGYRPKGPDGSGDWTARTGAWTKRGPGVIVHPDTDGARAALVAAGWSLPKKNGAVAPGPYATPLDGRGWGRGLLQLDAFGDVRDLVQPPPWPVEAQAAACCAQLHRNRVELQGNVPDYLLPLAVICRYNAALSSIYAGLDAGDVNLGTTGGDYGRDVQALEAAVVARWPDSGIQLPAFPAEVA